MRSSSNSPLTTLMVFIPLLAVPLLAVFGVPQLEPRGASSSRNAPDEDFFTHAGVGESLHHGAEDLFAPVRGSAAADSDQNGRWPSKESRHGMDGPADDTAGLSARMQGGSELDTNSQRGRGSSATNPFEERPQGNNRLGPPRPPDWSPPPDALQGWTVDSDEGRPKSGPTAGRGGSSNPLDDGSPQHPAGPADRDTMTTDSSRSLSWQQAVQRLNELGIHHFQLQPGRRSTEFHFSCSFQSPEHPRIIHRFEAEADEPLNAVQNVIAQVENWHQRR